MIITHIEGNEKDMDLSCKIVHTVEFTEEQMLKGHQRFLTTDGCDVAISLEPEEKLTDGAVLNWTENEVILVRAAVETVFVITPLDMKNWGKVCYNIGNMHKKAYLTDTEVLVPFDPVLEQILKKTGAPYQIEDRRIIGESANVSAKEHAVHGHHHHE